PTTTRGETTGKTLALHDALPNYTVDVPVTVRDEHGQIQADTNTPEADKVTVNKGETPSAQGAIKNNKDLPEGTKYEWKEPIDTTTPGDKTGTVVVTYPDGSKDTVDVPVTVRDEHGQTQADTNTPEADKVTVNKGETPSAQGAIKNNKDLPEGTKYEWKEPIDTTTPGDKTGTVVVTYPDGSKDTVDVPVTVRDEHGQTQADTN